MGVLCLTGGVCRSHDGAAGFVVECEGRQCSGKTGGSSLFVPITRNRLWVLKMVGGLSAVKGDFKFVNILNEVVRKFNSGQGEDVSGPTTPAKQKAPAAAGVEAGCSVAAGKDRKGDADPMAALLGAIAPAGKQNAVEKPRRNEKDFLEAPLSE